MSKDQNQNPKYPKSAQKEIEELESSIISTPSNIAFEVTSLVEEEKTFTPQEIHEALMFALDDLERSQIPFMLFGKLAEEVVKHQPSIDVVSLDVTKVHLGVLMKHITKPGLSTLKTIRPEVEITDDHILYDHKGVPIQIDIVYGQYPFFKYPTKTFYGVTEFSIPNPMSAYLEKMDKVK